MGAEILLSLLFCGAVLFVSCRGSDRPGMPRTLFAACAAAVFLAALLLRLKLGLSSDGFSTDMDTFKSWGSYLNGVGFSEIYKQDIYLDYPPGYLYVLSLLDRIRQALKLNFYASTYTLIMKLPSIFADLACGGGLLWLGARKRGEKAGLVLSCAYLFCPAVLINSAQWGQVDSVTTALLLCSVLCLYRGRYIPSALVYGLSIACKPQMLIFAPLYLFFALKEKKYVKLGVCVLCALGMILITAAPFTDGWNFLWLLEKYKATMDYYAYYSVNAYNFWAAVGWNWRGLPEGLSLHALTFAAPVAATALCGALIFRSKRRESVFLCPTVLMAVMYLFGIKMHERYLYPALLFLLVSVAFIPDRRLLRAFGLTAAAHYFNVAYVLYLFREKGGAYDPNSKLIRILAAGQVLCLGYALYAAFAAGLGREIKPFRARHPESWRLRPEGSGAFAAADIVILAAITLIYGAAAFRDLGGTRTALTSWAPAENASVILKAEVPCDRITYIPGVATNGANRPRTGVDILVETSTDGVFWENSGNLKDSGTYVFCWAHHWLNAPAQFVRLTSLNGVNVLNEVGLKAEGKTIFASVEAFGDGAQALIDEQDTVPYETTYLNSTYFDEIYHARTAYENILELEPYENTHPPLGKLIISLGIRAFGMNPFGWRFAGALFGVLMLPALYHLLKQLFGKTWVCGAGTAMFALDFMHFTQTRIATIDTYAVFFLILMYDLMVMFLKRDILRDEPKKLLLPLLLCGTATGLGVACKWTALYGAAGLAVLFFGKLILTLRDVCRQSGEFVKVDIYIWCRRALYLCLWCCLFFIAIPFAIYFASFLPMTTLPHNVHDIWGSFWRYQINMFNYHANLEATHAFDSPWYEWPLDVRPLWFYAGTLGGKYSTISTLGSPLLWWAGIPALFTAALLWIKERRTWAAALLCGYLSVYLPWVLVPRLTFIYHYFTAVPFIVVAIAGLFSRFEDTRLGSRGVKLSLPGGREAAVTVSGLFAGVFLLGLLLLFIAYFPVLSGAATDKAYVEALRLFDTWYF